MAARSCGSWTAASILPGDLAQKVDPYLRPLYDALYDLMGHERVHKAFERAHIMYQTLGPILDAHDVFICPTTNLPAVKADPKGAVAIQVAALSEEAKARQLASKLSAAGVPAYAEPKGPLTRVRAGPFANRMQAEKALARLQSLGYSGVVVPK